MIGVFFVTFFLVSKVDIIEKQYLLEKQVVRGRNYSGEYTTASLQVFVAVVNSQQFKASFNTGSDKVKLMKHPKNGLIVSFKGSSSEDVIAASKLWLNAVNKIEDKQRIESYQKHAGKMQFLEQKIAFLENYETKFSSANTLSDIALLNILNDNREVALWEKLSTAKEQLHKLRFKKPFIPTKYFLETRVVLDHYYPNRMVYIGISLISVVCWFLFLLGFNYRRDK